MGSDQFVTDCCLFAVKTITFHTSNRWRLVVSWQKIRPADRLLTNHFSIAVCCLLSVCNVADHYCKS